MARPKSKKPKKQRKFMHTAPLHTRRKLMAAHLSAELKKQYNRRSFPVRKGDEVVAMRGKFKKRGGKVARLNTKKYRVYIEGVMVKRTDGTERQAPIHPSNLRISKLNLDDKKRVASLTKKAPKKAATKQKAKKSPEKKLSEKRPPEKKKEKKS
jgi:large subunit ribosomal protein L24